MLVGRVSPVPGAHPWAWWAWGLSAAICISLSINPLFVVLVITSVLTVALLRRGDDLWARSLRFYLVLAGIVIAIRLFFRIVFSTSGGGPVLFTLPSIALPDWVAGFGIGGPVTSVAVLSALYSGLQLAGLLLCVGAINTLANPRTALKSVPAALQQASVAIVIALSVAPQLVVAMVRIGRAHRLRGGRTRGLRAIRGRVVPILADALDRSLVLATAMESRGFGRSNQPGLATTSGGARARRPRRALDVLLVVAVMTMVSATYLIFTTSANTRYDLGPAQVQASVLGWCALGVGAGLVVLGLWLLGRTRTLTRYRPQRWRWYDTTVVALGLGALTLSVVMLAIDPATATSSPKRWPELHPLMVLVAVLLVLPAWVAPLPRKGT